MTLLTALFACTWMPQPHYDTAAPAANLCDFEAPASGQGQIAGRVTSPSGKVPVAGAQLEVGGVSVVSGANGCFAVDLDPGTSALSAEKGRYATSIQGIETWAGERTDLGQVALDDGGVRIAVVYGKYDDVGALLNDLGLPFDVYSEPEELYQDPALLAQYDAVFANCGSNHTTRNHEEYASDELDNVRDWVLAGGTLYASDWEWELFEGAVPSAATFAEDPLTGPSVAFAATVLDRNIEALLGTNQADIHYDLSGWAVVEDVDEGTPLVIAEVEGTTRPLALMFWEGEGRAVFTTFHNETQITEDMRTILFELILAL